MENARRITDKFTTQDNIVTRVTRCGGKECTVLVQPDLSDAEAARAIVYSLVNYDGEISSLDDFSEKCVFEYDVTVSEDCDEATDDLLSGDIIVCLEGDERYAIVNARSYTTRGIVEPPTETVMRGPREGFIEDLKTNLSLLERRIKSPDFAIDRLTVGRKTKTGVAVCYISSVADKRVVKKLKKRLKKIDIDGIVDSNYLVPYIEERPYSLFSQTGISEKPDIVAAKLLEGRVAILIDGSPMAVTVPFVLIEEFQSGEDYYQRSTYGTFIRLLRYFGLMLATLLPGLYIALQNFHYTLIPVRFMITLVSAIKGLPLSPMAETLFVLVLFEIIREASVRMPRAVGMAMSIVGALVLGETAVNAGLISSPAVMITALSSIALFTVPNLIGPMSVLRLAYALVGGLFGLYGLIIAVMFSIHYVSALNGYGSPYLAPFAPLVFTDFKDAVERGVFPEMKKRPRSIPNTNETRQA